MTDEEIYGELQKGFDQQDKAFLLFHYQRLQPGPALNQNCPQCWHDAWLLLKYHLKTTLNMKPTSQKYRVLHENVWLEGRVLSHEATDEQIEALFLSNPELAATYFEKNPDQKPAGKG